MEQETMQFIPGSKIVTDTNDRTEFNQAELEKLAHSIDTEGLINLPTVRPLTNGDYEIVAGERRIRSMRDILGWTAIPCLVRELDDEQASAMMLAENTGRKDLNPMDEANAYQRRVERFGWSTERIAAAAGVSVKRVDDHLMLLTLVSDVQHFVKTGAFTLKFALMLVELDSNRQRIALRAFSTDPKMTLIKWREIVAQLNAQQAAESQISMFGFELVAQRIIDSAPSKGRQAITGAAAYPAMPAIRHTTGDSMSPIFARYITDLRAAGHADAAGAVANLYNLFVAKGWVTVTGQPLADTPTAVESNLHEELF